MGHPLQMKWGHVNSLFELVAGVENCRWLVELEYTVGQANSATRRKVGVDVGFFLTSCLSNRVANILFHGL